MINYLGSRIWGLNNAVAGDLIAEPYFRSIVNLGLWSWATHQPRIKPTVYRRQKYEDLAGDARTQHYWENTLGFFQFEQIVSTWLVEVARTETPAGVVAIMKSFEQYIREPQIEAQDIVLSESENWGNPGLSQGRYRWHFRIEPYRGLTTPVISSGPPYFLPGLPHPDLPFIDDIWYPAASPVSQNWHLIVDEKTRLRVFCEILTPTISGLELAAKIRGYRIGVYSSEALLSARSLW